MTFATLRKPIKSLFFPTLAPPQPTSLEQTPVAVQPSPTVNYWWKWLTPGLSLKRWLLLNAVGVWLIGIGVEKLIPIGFLFNFLETITKNIPNTILGAIAIVFGSFFLIWGQIRTIRSVAQASNPQGDRQLVKALLARRRLQRGSKIVALGGGTGLSTLLRGLKHHSDNLSAIVTVADDGGSSGRLRRENGVLPPGDIRNCLAALADEEKLLTELFQYRFRAGEGLTGHSFGNLFLVAMSDIVGDFERAIAASSQVLAIRGRVLPATLSDVHLWAELADGRLIEGESQIPQANGQIVKIGCFPANPPALPATIEAIAQADYIVIGPGSLYTSIIPNLLVPEIRDAIAKSQVPKIYICNLMTQPGETDNYTVSDHIRAIDRACGGKRLFDTVLVHQKPPSFNCLRRYAEENAHLVFVDREEVAHLGCKIVWENVMEEDSKTGYIRHNSQKLATAIQKWFKD